MDTPICFLCLKTIKRDPFQLQQLVGQSETYLFSSVFSKLAQEYLGLEEEVGVGLSEVFKNVSNFCDKCEVVIGSLCEMYLEHLGIQLRLRWKLSELGKLLEKSKIGVSEKLESVIIHSLANQVDSSVRNVKHLRSTLVEKCIQKGNTNPPLPNDIKVEVESSCGGDDDPEFFLTHEVKNESFSSSEDLAENDESNENRIDKQDQKVKCETIQFHDETETIEADFDFLPPDRNTCTNSNPSGSDSNSERCSTEGLLEEDEKRKRRPRQVRKRKRAVTPKVKCSKTGAQKRLRMKKEMECSLQLEGWNCSICNEPTVDKTNLKKHLICHQERAISKPFQCTFCWRSRESHVSLNNHLILTHMTVAGDGAYSCEAPECTFAFSTLEELNSHSETHLKPEKSLRFCKTCGIGCLDLTRLKLHKIRHIQPIKLLSADETAPKRKGSMLLYPCSSCDEIFPKFLELHDHFCRLHCSGLSAIRYKCPNCGKAARYKQLHRCGIGRGKTKPKLLKLICTDCEDQKEYKNWYSLQAHRRDFHIPIKCSRCGETINGHLAKEEHDEICFDLHHCSTCGKGYSSAQNLENHKRKVHIERRFKCSLCDKAFKVKLYLQEHMAALHSLEKSHSCVHCGKSYATRGYMMKHLSFVHQMETSGEKKHHCPSCKESFGRKQSLESHILRCDPAAAVAIMCTCEICGRPIMGGRQKAMMEKHVITHMSPQERTEYWKEQGKEEVVHLCPICGKEFKKKQSLERHAAMHGGDFVKKTFLCEQCPKVFPGKHHLHQHMKHVHWKSIRVAPCEICGRPVMDGLKKTMMEKHVVTHMSPQELAEYYKIKGRDFYVCLTCGKKFTKKQNLERHSGIHETKKDFQCEQCPKIFKGKFNLYQHVRMYHSKSKGE